MNRFNRRAVVFASTAQSATDKSCLSALAITIPLTSLIACDRQPLSG
jgi:hypothetical protein